MESWWSEAMDTIRPTIFSAGRIFEIWFYHLFCCLAFLGKKQSTGFSIWDSTNDYYAGYYCPYFIKTTRHKKFYPHSSNWLLNAFYFWSAYKISFWLRSDCVLSSWYFSICLLYTSDAADDLTRVD